MSCRKAAPDAPEPRRGGRGTGIGRSQPLVQSVGISAPAARSVLSPCRAQSIPAPTGPSRARLASSGPLGLAGRARPRETLAGPCSPLPGSWRIRKSAAQNAHDGPSGLAVAGGRCGPGREDGLLHRRDLPAASRRPCDVQMGSREKTSSRGKRYLTAGAGVLDSPALQVRYPQGQPKGRP